MEFRLHLVYSATISYRSVSADEYSSSIGLIGNVSTSLALRFGPLTWGLSHVYDFFFRNPSLIDELP